MLARALYFNSKLSTSDYFETSHVHDQSHEGISQPLPEYFTQTRISTTSFGIGLFEATQVILVAARNSACVSMQIPFSIVGKE